MTLKFYSLISRKKSEKNLEKWWEYVQGMTTLRTIGRSRFTGIIFLEVNLSISINRNIFFTTALESSKPKLF